MAKANRYIISKKVLDILQRADRCENEEKIKLVTDNVVRVTLRFDDDDCWFVPIQTAESWKINLQDAPKDAKFVKSIYEVGNKWRKINKVDVMEYEKFKKHLCGIRLGSCLRKDLEYVKDEYKTSDGNYQLPESKKPYGKFFADYTVRGQQIFDLDPNEVLIPWHGSNINKGQFTLKNEITVKDFLDQKIKKGMLDCYAIDENSLVEKSKEYGDFFVTTEEASKIQTLKETDFENDFWDGNSGRMHMLREKIKHKKFSSLKPEEKEKLLEIYNIKK